MIRDRWKLTGALVIICCIFIPIVASSASTIGVDGQWQSLHFQNNPLVGKFYSVTRGRVEEAEIVRALNKANHLLIGEIHNNLDHHEIQAHFVMQFSQSKNSKPAVVFEMVPKRLQSILSGAKLESLNTLGKSLEWKKRGWYSFQIYRPIFEVSLREELPLIAGNIERKLTRQIARKGLNSLTNKQLQALSLQVQLSKQMRKSLELELQNSHCGLLPTTAFGSMVNVQRARDGAMANAMGTSGTENTILIAGNGHVRRDRGVPRLLNSTKTLVIGLIEVNSAEAKYSDYQLKNQQGEALYDFVYFTPKVDIVDQCAALKKRFKKKKPASE